MRGVYAELHRERRECSGLVVKRGKLSAGEISCSRSLNERNCGGLKNSSQSLNPTEDWELPYLRVAERYVDGGDTLAVSGGLGVSVEGNSWSTTLVRKGLGLAHRSTGTF